MLKRPGLFALGIRREERECMREKRWRSRVLASTWLSGACIGTLGGDISFTNLLLYGLDIGKALRV